MNTSRIPVYVDSTIDGMTHWFAEMFEKGLLFHPDDAPESIISISTGEKFFSHNEDIKIKEILDAMFSNFGDKVYEAAFPFFMQSLGIKA